MNIVTNSRVTDTIYIKPTISIVTLNNMNISIKRQRFSEWVKR
jgi:hypothetical protein